jgi:A/G-specific adenine glycosylase
MWEFPHGELIGHEMPVAAAKRLLADLTGVRAKIGPEWLTVRHTVTRFRITMVCLEAEYRGGELRSDYYTEGRWVPPTALAQYPVSSPQRKLARSLIAGPRQKSLF